MIFRLATEKDIPDMCQIRKQQLIDEGSHTVSDIDDELYCFFTDRLSDGSLVEWLLEDKGKVIATAGILFLNFPPAYSNPAGTRGYVINMYTAPEYRRQGIATMMLKKLTEEAEKRSVRLIMLHASKLGKPVYKKFGFVETDEWLMLDLESRS